MHHTFFHKNAIARIASLLTVGLGATLAASAQSTASADPFMKDAVAGFNARTFYMDIEDNSKPPASTQKQAWAFGGKLFGRTGYWNDMVQFGASYYLAAPLDAPDDKDGTGLLAPGQKTISVLGELYARLKYEKQTLTLGRQEIDMGYKRASGVRGNRSDATYLGKQDNRMVPITYEAALLGGPLSDSLNYYAGWVNKAKPRNSEEFSSVGSVIGAKGSDSAMWMGGVQFAPMKDVWVQGWYHVVSDVMRISFVDADYVYRLSKESHLRFAAQYTDQRSEGSNALTGKAFSTSNAQAYGEYGMNWLTVYGAYSRTGSGADLRLPFTSGPIYTQQVTRTFIRAHETAWQLGVGADLATWAPGVTAFVDVTSGKDAINANTGAKLADQLEYDAGAVWTLKQKGSYLDGLRARVRYGWVTDKTQVGDKKSTDLRIDVNLPINLL
jgi:outer membrane porin, OprD family